MEKEEEELKKEEETPQERVRMKGRERGGRHAKR